MRRFATASPLGRYRISSKFGVRVKTSTHDNAACMMVYQLRFDQGRSNGKTTPNLPGRYPSACHLARQQSASLFRVRRRFCRLCQLASGGFIEAWCSDPHLGLHGQPCTPVGRPHYQRRPVPNDAEHWSPIRSIFQSRLPTIGHLVGGKIQIVRHRCRRLSVDLSVLHRIESSSRRHG